MASTDNKPETAETPATNAPAAASQENGDAPLKMPKRVPQPDDKKHKERLAQISDQINKCHETLKEIRAALDNNDGKSKGGDPVTNAVREELKRLSDQINDLFEEKNKVRASLNSVITRRNQKEEEIKRQPKSKFTDPAAIEAKIQELEYNLSVSTMSLKEEQNLLRDINTLKASKNKVADVEKQRKALNNDRDAANSLHAQIKDLDKKINELKDQQKNEKKKLTTLIEKAKGERGGVPQLLRQRDDTRKKLNKLLEERRTANEEHNNKYTVWKAYRKELAKVNAVRRAKEAEERKAEQAARDEERKAELAHIHPWADEIYACDQIIDYLRKLLPSKKEEAVVEKKDVELKSGERIIGKNAVEEDSFINLAGGKKQKNKKKATKKAQTQILSHPPDALVSYEKMGMNPPLTLAQVPESIDEMEAKKKDFESKDAAAKEEYTAQQEAQKKNQKKPTAPKSPAKKQDTQDLAGPKPNDKASAVIGAWSKPVPAK